MSSGSKIFMVQEGLKHYVLVFLNLSFSNSKKVKSNPCCSRRSFFSRSAVSIVVTKLNRCGVDLDTPSPTLSLLIQNHYPKPIVLKTVLHKNSFLHSDKFCFLAAADTAHKLL